VFRNRTKLLVIAIGLIITLAISIASINNGFGTLSAARLKKQISITTMLDDQGDPSRPLKMFYQPALEELRSRHPDIDIKLDYRPIPYLNLHTQFLKAMANQTPIDIITVDQIWMGEFVQKGFLTDLTNLTRSWGRESDWYPASWAAGLYNHKVYGINPYADVRGMWYWKDLLNKAGVDPNSLRTWDGYIASAKKLNAVLRPQGIEGVHLVGAPHSPDIEFYPYLWMLGGEIIKQKTGHPTKGTYWFPAFNGTEGVKALGFIKAQIDAGVKPQRQHFWGKELLDRKFAVMLEALQNHVHLNTTEQKQAFEQKVGFFPTFPTPKSSDPSATLMGGEDFSIPQTSKNKDLAWELITLILDPKIMAPFNIKYGLLPTQTTIGNGPYTPLLNQTIPYYNELISMLSIARTRPNIPEYPQIAENIRQAIEQIYNGTKEPQQALNEAASKSAKVLGW
jgi:multiple sugar transport system substrate-binding protein